MTQTDKELLLKDLCARLPYRVRCSVTKYSIDREMIFIKRGPHALELNISNIKELIMNELYEVKPYLFPLSSMTEEQKRDYNSLHDLVPTSEPCEIGNLMDNFELVDNWRSIDYLNAHHFDYRGLIEKDLAINATGLNIY